MWLPDSALFHALNAGAQSPGWVLALARFASDILPVLMVSAQTDKSYPKRAKACGAKGFIGKEASLERLVEAVNAIQKGGVWFTGAD